MDNHLVNHFSLVTVHSDFYLGSHFYGHARECVCVYTNTQKRHQIFSAYPFMILTRLLHCGQDRRRDILLREGQEHRALPTGLGLGLKSLGDARIQ